MDLEDALMSVKFVLHGRDASFTAAFDAVFQAPAPASCDVSGMDDFEVIAERRGCSGCAYRPLPAAASPSGLPFA